MCVCAEDLACMHGVIYLLDHDIPAKLEIDHPVQISGIRKSVTLAQSKGTVRGMGKTIW